MASQSATARGGTSRSRARVTWGVYLRLSGGSPARRKQPLLLGLELDQSRARLHLGDDGARPRTAESVEIVDRDVDRIALDAVEQMRRLVRGAVVDVAQEAQGDVIVVGVDPAGAVQPAAQEGEAIADIGRHFERGEQAWHGDGASVF